jgi:hypothetical protein
MRLEVEGQAPREDPSSAEVRAAVLGLRSYGPSSFASITDDDGSYIQVGGGGVGCVLERRDTVESRHYRGYHDSPSKVFPDGTVLAFSGGSVAMRADEWFTVRVVADAFVAFLERRPLPEAIRWRDISEMFEGLQGRVR